MASSLRTVVIGLTNLRAELCFNVAEETSWTEFWNCRAAFALLARFALNRFGTCFGAVEASRTVEAVVFVNCAFEINVGACSTSTWFDHAERTEVTFRAFVTGRYHAFIRAVSAFVALQTVSQILLEFVRIIGSRRAFVFILAVDPHVADWWTPGTGWACVPLPDTPFANVAGLASSAVGGFSLFVSDAHCLERARHRFKDTHAAVLARRTLVAGRVRVRDCGTVAHVSSCTESGNRASSAVVASSAVLALAFVEIEAVRAVGLSCVST